MSIDIDIDKDRVQTVENSDKTKCELHGTVLVLSIQLFALYCTN